MFASIPRTASPSDPEAKPHNEKTHLWLWLRTVHKKVVVYGITNSKKNMGWGTTFQVSHDLLISQASPVGELGIAIGDASSYPLVVELLARNAEPHQQMGRDPAQLHSSVPEGMWIIQTSRISRHWQPTSYVIKTYLNTHFTSFLQHEINQSFWSIPPEQKKLGDYFLVVVFHVYAKLSCEGVSMMPLSQ